MADHQQQPNVTRREFTSALAFAWVFITLALGAKLEVERHWTSVVLVAVASVTPLTYAIASIRSRSHLTPDAGDWTITPKQLLAAGEKVGAITAVRKGTRLGLRDAKELVESWEEPRVAPDGRRE
jgi:ribosomal protein L7/L12